MNREFSCGIPGSGVVTAAAGVAAVVQVGFLVQEIPHAVGSAKKKKQNEKTW